jgi:hypothetical protein
MPGGNPRCGQSIRKRAALIERNPEVCGRVVECLSNLRLSECFEERWRSIRLSLKKLGVPLRSQTASVQMERRLLGLGESLPSSIEVARLHVKPSAFLERPTLDRAHGASRRADNRRLARELIQ